MNRTKGIETFINTMKNVPNIQWDEIAERLDNLGFFVAPASIGHHGNYDGGLFEHSFEVTMQLLTLTEKLDLVWDDSRSPYIVGMFHDICKCDNYTKIEEKWEYRNDILLPGHGEKSIILAQQILGPLTDEEITCIRWHMGAFDDKENWKYYSRSVTEYPNVLFTHTADMMASHILGI